MVGLGGWVGVTGLEGLLHRLAEERLVGVVDLSGGRVGSELGLLLPPLHDDEHAHNAAHDGYSKRTDQAPDPHGNGTAVILSRTVLRAAGRCALGGLVLPLDLMLVVVLEGDLRALDRAAVGLGDLAREGDGLGDIGGAVVVDAVEVQRLNDVLVALVLDVL